VLEATSPEGATQMILVGVDLHQRLQEALDIVFVGESFYAVEFVFENSFVQVAGYADVDSSRQAADDYVRYVFSLSAFDRG
jgi:hypothetical protein